MSRVSTPQSKSAPQIKQAANKPPSGAAAPFLTAQWRHLVMLNFEVPPSLVEPYLPRSTVLDFFNGQTYVSLVGFMFLDTRLKGWAVPFHRSFEEVNLRLYVRRELPEEIRRGVVFIRELVPKMAVAVIAKAIYNEQYLCCPMRHTIRTGDAADDIRQVQFAWKIHRAWHRLGVDLDGPPRSLRPGSLEEFIAEHYWGYSRQRDGGTKEYRVDHPSWNYCPASNVQLEIDVAQVYGPAFAPFLVKPASAFLADGSAVQVYPGKRIA